MRLSNAIRIAVLLVLLLSVLPLLAQDTLPAFEAVECPFFVPSSETEGETIWCGYLIVPEDRSNPNSPAIELAVAVIQSTNLSAPYDPIVYLEGGPGGSALAGVDIWYESALRNVRDIILFDQRGTGYSIPSLNCPEMEEDYENPVQACHNRLVAEGVNLAAYTSVENAADVADLAFALNIESVNLYGVSYGTRLALTILRDHSERIRSVMIDAVYPPQVAGFDEQTLYADQAFQVLFDGCVMNASCNAAFPNLREVFYRLVDDLNAMPVTIEDPETGEPYDLTGDDVVNEVFGMLYDAEAIPNLPALIYAYSEGNYQPDFLYPIDFEEMTEEEFDTYVMEYLGYDTLDELYTYYEDLTDAEWETLMDEVYASAGVDAESTAAWEEAMMAYLGLADVEALYEYLEGLSDEEYGVLEEEALGIIDDDSEGMFHSVECYEEAPFNSLAAAQSLSVNVVPQIREAMLVGVEESLADCAIWNVPAAPTLENEPVISDIPTLVLSGQYDPITPPAWGQAAADYLSQSYHFVLPGLGHGAVDTHECPTAIALAFLDNPNVAPDANCIAAMTGPDFVVP